MRKLGLACIKSLKFNAIRLSKSRARICFDARTNLASALIFQWCNVAGLKMLHCTHLSVSKSFGELH